MWLWRCEASQYHGSSAGFLFEGGDAVGFEDEGRAREVEAKTDKRREDKGVITEQTQKTNAGKEGDAARR